MVAKINIELREITPDNWRKVNSLEVKRVQKTFVADNVAILARAFAYRKDNSKVFVVYFEDTEIGLIMQRDFRIGDKKICILDQFMIDEHYQGLGYGKIAMGIWICNIKREKLYDSIEFCYKEENIMAKQMYEKLGFVRSPQKDDEDELVMEYFL